MVILPYIHLSGELDSAGLLWQPEIGDEVSLRKQPENISILVHPDGMTPTELRSTFLWLPTVEQIVHQMEARQAILFHAGLDISGSQLLYKTVVHACGGGHIECVGQSLRFSLGLALKDLLTQHFREGLMH